jgi:hypothetical protein
MNNPLQNPMSLSRTSLFPSIRSCLSVASWFDCKPPYIIPIAIKDSLKHFKALAPFNMFGCLAQKSSDFHVSIALGKRIVRAVNEQLELGAFIAIQRLFKCLVIVHLNTLSFQAGPCRAPREGAPKST